MSVFPSADSESTDPAGDTDLVYDVHTVPDQRSTVTYVAVIAVKSDVSAAPFTKTESEATVRVGSGALYASPVAQVNGSSSMIAIDLMLSAP